MNPILSDLNIRMVIAEQQAGIDARSQLRQAAASRPHTTSRVGAGRALVAAVQQFVDPRGYALRQAEAATMALRERAAAPQAANPEPAADVVVSWVPYVNPAELAVARNDTDRPIAA